MKKQYISPAVYVVHLGGTDDIMEQPLVVVSSTDKVNNDEDIGWVKEDYASDSESFWNDDWREQ